MMAKALTHSTVSSAKAKPGQRLELWDRQVPGLCLRVTDRGAKSWVLRYRSRHGGQPRYKFGDATQMALVAARAEAIRLKAEIAAGNEPAAARRTEKQAVAAQPIKTFNDLIDRYFEACASGLWKPKKKVKRAQTIGFEQRLADRHVRPKLGALKVADVTRPVVRDLLRGMYIGDPDNADPAKRRPAIGSQTNRVHAIVRQVFNWAMSEDLTDTNPALAIQSLHSEVKRRRIWSDEELARLWTACQAPDALRDDTGERVYVARSTAIAVQLCAILLQRRVEVSGMAVAELNLKERTWEVSPERMKGGRAQLVPLPPHAIELIREAMALAKGEDDEQPPFVFPSPRDKSVPITAGALTQAVRKMRGATGADDATCHDLRRTGSTIMTSERLGISPFIRSQVLGHGTDTGGGSAVSSAHYDVNQYLTEKRRALEAWEGLLLEIVGARVRD